MLAALSLSQECQRSAHEINLLVSSYFLSQLTFHLSYYVSSN